MKIFLLDQIKILLYFLNIDQIPLKFQKQFLFFIENPNFFKSSNIILDHKIITISDKNLRGRNHKW